MTIRPDQERNTMDQTNKTHDEHDALLDRAIDSARGDLPNAEETRASGERTWARVSETLDAERPLVTDADYEALVPAYLDGTLSEAKTMLIADRIGANAAYRKMVETARRGDTPLVSARPAPLRFRRTPVWAAAAAAAVVLAAGGWLFGRDLLMPQRVLAHVDTVDGALYRVGDDGMALADGAEIRPRERLLASRDGGAVIELADGSRIELAPRSEISLATRWNGQTIRLNKGNIIVQAAPQRDGRLFVATEECVVSVTGTIFSVRHGTKGSRVGVLEGEVRVDQAGERTVLLPGMQVSTNPSLSPVPMQDEVAWSRDHERWTEILQELRALGEEIDANVELPEPRTASILLDQVPANTAVFMSLPNLSDALGESYDLFRERVAQSASLSEWWNQNFDDPEDAARLDALVARLGSVGDSLGDEIVVALALDEDGDPGMPIALAEVRDASAFRTAVEAGVADLSDELDAEDLPIRWVDDPVAALAELHTLTIDPEAIDGSQGATDDDSVLEEGAVDDIDVIVDIGSYTMHDESLNLWVADGLLVASPSLETLAAMAGESAGLPGDFRARVVEAYDKGVDLVFAVDLEQLGSVHEALEEGGAPDLIGLSEAQHLIVTQVTRDGRSQMEAGLTYKEGRAGVAAWLGEPAAMGGLDFISPDAHAATAVIMERPEQIIETLFGLVEAEDPEAVLDPEVALSRELMTDVASALGGEVAFALDGPVLPRPSWRAAIEVYDADALQLSIERIIDEINAKAMEFDPNAVTPPFVLVSDEIGDRAAWTITLDIDVESLEFRPSVHYTYAEGYLVAAPSSALVEAAIRQRESGVGLGSSAAFVNAMPTGGEINFSAVAWQNLGGLVEEAARFADERGEDALGMSFDLADSFGPSLFYAWVEPDAVRFAGTADESPFGLGTLFGIGSFGNMSGPNGMDGMNGMFDELHRELEELPSGVMDEASADYALEYLTADLLGESETK